MNQNFINRKEDGWDLALKLLKTYLHRPGKSSMILSELPKALSSKNRQVCQYLFLGSLRHFKLIDYLIEKTVLKKPRRELLLFLMLALVELIENKKPEKAPKIIHYLVNEAKKRYSINEVGFVNAVLRKINAIFENLSKEEKMFSKDWLSLRYSHPEWLINRWFQYFGGSHTVELLKWDQAPPSIYIRLSVNTAPVEKLIGEGEGLAKTPWNGFYEHREKRWQTVQTLLEKGFGYIQDPSTRFVKELADVQPTDRVLDLCAAPGGKSRLLGECLGPKGQLVAIDLPGNRILQLKENLLKIEGVPIAILEKDVLALCKEDFTKAKLPINYDKVILDAPCSNTGVLRRRPDAKWRLRESDIQSISQTQLQLLLQAAKFVKPGGNLIYSTCSIEPEENAGVIEAFLKTHTSAFSLLEEHAHKPWETGHDGGAVYLLTKAL